MKIDKIQNNYGYLSTEKNYSPSMKSGLYFTKPGVLFNSNANFVNPKGQKITPKGIRFFQDTELAEDIRKKIAEIPFVRELSKKYETFVSVIQGRAKEDTHIGKIEIKYADYKKNKVKIYEAYGVSTKKFRHFIDGLHSISERKMAEKLENPIDIAIAKIQYGIFD